MTMTLDLVEKTVEEFASRPIEYQGQLLVTPEMIAKVHECSRNNVDKNFSRHRDRFAVGKHFFEIPYDIWSELESASVFGCDPESQPKKGGHRGAKIGFTKRGYLLLTKIFEDALSFEIMERLIDGYFESRIIADHPDVLAIALDNQRMLIEGNARTEATANLALDRSERAEKQSERAEQKADLAIAVSRAKATPRQIHDLVVDLLIKREGKGQRGQRKIHGTIHGIPDVVDGQTVTEVKPITEYKDAPAQVKAYASELAPRTGRCVYYAEPGRAIDERKQEAARKLCVIENVVCEFWEWGLEPPTQRLLFSVE